MAFDWFSDTDDSGEMYLLQEGEYVVRLEHYREERRAEYDCLIFNFTINGRDNFVPHEITLLSPVDPTDTAGKKRSKFSLNSFYRCFGVDPATSAATPDDFYHRQGRIKISRNIRGYLTVTEFKPADVIKTILHSKELDEKVSAKRAAETNCPPAPEKENLIF